MSFIKSADNRRDASFAVRSVRKIGVGEDEDDEEVAAVDEDVNIAEGNPFMRTLRRRIWYEEDG